MEVRGPALAYLGFKPTNRGLEAFMASRDPGDDMSALSDEEFVPMVDSHNRIVLMMQGMSPARIPDALSLRGEKARRRSLPATAASLDPALHPAGCSPARPSRRSPSWMRSWAPVGAHFSPSAPAPWHDPAL